MSICDGKNYIDDVTGVYNRNYLDEFYKNNNDNSYVLVYLDVDNFKYINDTYGYSFGDRLLRYMAKTINKLLNKNGILIRFSGDEFLILFKDNDINYVQNYIQKIIDNFNKVFEFENKEILITLSAGIYMTNKREELCELIRKSDLALYVSKNTGKSKVTLYDEDIEEKVKRKTELLTKLRKAIDGIDENEFYLVYQPILDMETLKIKEVEALARCKCEGIGEVYPIEFIPLLEETGLIKEFGNIILEKVFRQIKEWDEKGFELNVNVNLSPIQLRDKKIISKIKELKEIYKIDLNRLIFEITETKNLKFDKYQQEIFKELIEMGITLAIDDYGNDYSQMTNVINVPAKEIKLSKEIIHLIDKDDKAKLMIKYFINLFNSLEYITVAEGVETDIQFKELKHIGCRKIQGYYLSKPISAKMIENILKENTCITI